MFIDNVDLVHCYRTVPLSCICFSWILLVICRCVQANDMLCFMSYAAVACLIASQYLVVHTLAVKNGFLMTSVQKYTNTSIQVYSDFYTSTGLWLHECVSAVFTVHRICQVLFTSNSLLGNNILYYFIILF